MQNTEVQVLLGTVAAVLLPVIVSYLKQCSWADKTKTFVSVGVATALGTLTVYATNQLDLKNWIGTISAIYAAATIVYQTWFKHLAFNEWLENKNNE